MRDSRASCLSFERVTNLADRLSCGTMLPAEAMRWTLRLCQRVEQLHAGGHVHGRISPRAILVGESRAVLLDPGTVPELVEYLSPERAAFGPPAQSDDTWAIAVTLYELVTGSRPFALASEEATRMAIRNTMTRPIASFGVKDDLLQRLLDAALAKDIRVRTAGVSTLRRQVEACYANPGADDAAPLDDDTELGGDTSQTFIRRVGGPRIDPEAEAAAPPTVRRPSARNGLRW
jgi:serine/threonine protein kinase